MELSENPTYPSICKIVGKKHAMKLSLYFGGKNLEIPLHAKPNCQLAIAIGVDNAKKIVDVYGGMRWCVPITYGRVNRVLNLRKSGKTLSQIVEEEKIALRTVTTILAEKADEDQGYLF